MSKPSVRSPPAKPSPSAVQKTGSQSEGRVEPDVASLPKVLAGKAYVIDGDTIVIMKTHIRISGIDAPEMDHPWGRKSKSAMIALCKGHTVTAELEPGMTYDRVVAKCHLEDGTDLAAELVRQGLALDWAKYSGGRYRHLEPDGIRKKLWRAAARQQGRYKPGT
ncbi:MAG: thermonuclease family protein [Parvularcula sp.]|jgi:endonuclease YncB( thermonuclease family)|nr:thermonuclease family protein [Parvularcula sp.]